MSTLEYMLYHQNMLAQVKAESRFLPASQTFSPATRWFDCRHSHTSACSRKYQPLATAPWPDGARPVSRVDCAVQVTAGMTVWSGRMPPRATNPASSGVLGPISRLVSPTIRRTRVLRICSIPKTARALSRDYKACRSHCRQDLRASSHQPVRADGPRPTWCAPQMVPALTPSEAAAQSPNNERGTEADT